MRHSGVLRGRLLPVLAGVAAMSALGAGVAGAAPAGAPAVPGSVATAGVAGTGVPGPDPRAAAQAQVDALGAEVTRTAAALAAGTQRLADGQARLAQTQAAAAAQVAADQAHAQADEARALLGRIVNASYRAPRPDGVTLALGTAPGRLEALVLGEATLDHVRGNQDDALRDASLRGEQAEDLSRSAAALAEDAAAQTRDLDAQVATLQAQAEATRLRLDSAAAALSAAQVAQAATDAARAAAAAGALTDASDGAALCTTPSTSGYPNGFLPAAVLCPLSVGGGQRLGADAAAAFNRMAAAHAVCVTDSYRSYGQQVDVYGRKPDLAAVPGTSNHGLGLAVDLCGGVEVFGSPEYDWMVVHAAAYGFVHPAWAEPGGSRPEPWHWEFAV